MGDEDKWTVQVNGVDYPSDRYENFRLVGIVSPTETTFYLTFTKITFMERGGIDMVVGYDGETFLEQINKNPEIQQKFTPFMKYRPVARVEQITSRINKEIKQKKLEPNDQAFEWILAALMQVTKVRQKSFNFR